MLVADAAAVAAWRSRRAGRMTTSMIDRYANTILAFGGDGCVSIDLRRPLSASDRRALHGLGFSSCFAVITPDNPGGRDVSARENDTRESKLVMRVRETDVRFAVAVGCSPDRSHCEEGLAVELPRHEARELAREFAQDALFWYDGEDFWLDAACARFAAVKLPP
jgi:Protein of unknown function (DUF3293)